jgi:hypothetical protein
LSQRSEGRISFVFLQKRERANVSKPKIEWDEKGEAEDYDRAVKFLSLLCPNTKAGVYYFDERAPIPCWIVDIDYKRSADAPAASRSQRG